ncbi:DUF551 domain-containing protein [Salmonella enterica subsp. enterica serovar Reading]|uniref:DUF551 domain-containing protein n=3 Tax=Enterobacteriaceae TaxID=543 RepID=A0A5U6CGD3_SALER|nr:DUF551 domain-containing protein [Salmonella enterica]ECI3247465.1 DUF551 domain-containing protein [Salmonella enterica subsp. enterica serovar 4,[5],12:i:-]EHU1080519.1 DUF551 domain-containing protein [Salmonella enterica subsp. enterica serovar Reading]EAS2569320.1 DUF551 domain-containing protein [Salmonella enterica]EAS5531429.1 DUF551 domain-containing protein [Salmonella enterica]
MTTMTKERLLTIKQWRETYGPGSNVVLPAEEAEELARIALASLEAEPIGEVSEKRLGLVMDGTVDLGGKSTYRIIKGEKAMKLLPLGTKFYTAPPVPVVPEEKPMPNPLSMYTVDAVAAIAEVRGWNACRAAMLHGAEPVSQTYKLPPLSSSEVNDAAWKLHNMLTEHVPLNGRQFNNLKGCFYEALKVAMRNYPVTPDGWISCSERMPAQDDWILIYSKHGEYMAGQVQEEYVELSDGTLSWLGNALFWMPLPEPPQEAK